MLIALLSVKVKVKMPYPYWDVDGVLISFSKAIEPADWVRDAWPVRRQTYGYLPSRRASPPFDWFQIILLGEQRHMCEQLARGCYLVRSWTCNLGLRVRHAVVTLPSHSMPSVLQRNYGQSVTSESISLCYCRDILQCLLLLLRIGLGSEDKSRCHVVTVGTSSHIKRYMQFECVATLPCKMQLWNWDTC